MPMMVSGSGAQQPDTRPCEPRSVEREEEEGDDEEEEEGLYKYGYITTTQITITFTSAQTGNVYLN